MGMASDGGTAGGARRYSSRRGRGVLVVLLPLVLMICLAAAVAEAAEGQQRQLRRRKKGGGDDKGQSAPAHRDESRNVHGDSGMVRGDVYVYAHLYTRVCVCACDGVIQNTSTGLTHS